MARKAHGYRERGSPPHAWGQRSPVAVRSGEARFTPTRVGTTSPDRSPNAARTVHPHTRGDNHIPPTTYDPPSGSPPHAWGQLTLLFDLLNAHPVHPHTRGDNWYHGRNGRAGTVHPHTRGDNKINNQRHGRAAGSPPHAWGQPARCSATSQSRRFTPTRVGTTLLLRHANVALPVHPHTRGDNHVKVRQGAGRAGSPPHAWGQREELERYRNVNRFTPTRVGTTSMVHHTRGDN